MSVTTTSRHKAGLEDGKAMSVEDNIRILANAGPTFDGGSERSRREIATEWDEYLPDMDITPWVEAGCWSASTADQLRGAGFRAGSNTLRYSLGKERDDMDPMYALCNGDVSLADLRW